MILSASQSHHAMSVNVRRVFSSKRYRMTSAGFPPTIANGSTLRVTTDFVAMIAPFPTWTPGMIVAPYPIQTSWPMTVSPRLGHESGVATSHPLPIRASLQHIIYYYSCSPPLETVNVFDPENLTPIGAEHGKQKGWNHALVGLSYGIVSQGETD